MHGPDRCAVGDPTPTVGDGVLSVFMSAREAVSASVEFQRGMAWVSEARDGGVTVRVGLSSGEVFEADKGEPHAQVLAADVDARLTGTMPGIAFRPLGPVRLAGFDEPIGL